jgi:hypothetical protein
MKPQPSFRKESSGESGRDKQRIAALEAKLKTKNEVLPELVEEHVALKKALGDFKGHLGASEYPGYRLWGIIILTACHKETSYYFSISAILLL